MVTPPVVVKVVNLPVLAVVAPIGVLLMLPAAILPVTFNAPPIPVPPVTISAPVLPEVETVALLTHSGFV